MWSMPWHVQFSCSFSPELPGKTAGSASLQRLTTVEASCFLRRYHRDCRHGKIETGKQFDIRNGGATTAAAARFSLGRGDGAAVRQREGGCDLQAVANRTARHRPQSGAYLRPHLPALFANNRVHQRSPAALWPVSRHVRCPHRIATRRGALSADAKATCHVTAS